MISNAKNNEKYSLKWKIVIQNNKKSIKKIRGFWEVMAEGRRKLPPNVIKKGILLIKKQENQGGLW